MTAASTQDALSWFNHQVDPYRLESASQYVYRYRPPGRLLDEIKSRRAYMSSFLKLNDPKESGALFFSLHTRQRGVDLPMLNEVSQSATKFARAHAKALCLTLDHDSAAEFGNLEAMWGRGFSRPRMWAQYADNHRGACLIFDRAALEHAIVASKPPASQLWDGPVQYCNPPRIPTAALGQVDMLDYDRVIEVGLERAVFEHITTHRQAIFFQKALDWRDELEHRWIIWDNEYSSHSVEFGDALKGVVVGCDFDVTTYRALCDACAEHQILVRRMAWRNGAPDIEHLPLPGFRVSPEKMRSQFAYHTDPEPRRGRWSILVSAKDWVQSMWRRYRR
jgi:hypothetical protein